MVEVLSSATRRDGLLPGAVGVPPAGTWVARGPHDGFSVCHLCHGPAKPAHPMCWSCATVLGQLGSNVPRVVPIFLFALGSGAHAHLVGYKGSPAPGVRAARARALTDLLGSFLARHGTCLVGDPDCTVALVPVPSTCGGRSSWGGVHPLVGVCRAAAGADARRRIELHDVLRPTGAPARRLAASGRAFAVEGERLAAAGARALVVDDVFASGARALSAAAALEDSGVDVAAVVPLGRLVRPDHNPATAAFWRVVARTPAGARRCCVCTGRRRAVACSVSAARPAVVLRLAA